ncbi:MAG: hypothetical protein HYT89_05210 [Candidatus Omnitrophica bacterium]|nr:hypothetical protein [Candidatus Omnitrophota bacterium]
MRRRQSLVPILIIFFSSFAAPAAAQVSAPSPMATESDRQEWIQATYENGKRLYERGDYNAAFREWDKLNPYFSENTVLKKLVDYMKQQARTAQVARPAPRRVPAGSGDAGKATFRRAEILYYQGKYAEAIAIWDELAPTLPPGSEERTLIELIKENHAKAASKGNVGQTEEKNAPVAVPADLKKILLKADKKFKALAEEVETARRESEEKTAGRQARVIDLYQKGKDAFAEDHWEEALEAWQPLAAILEEGSEEKRLILSLSENYSRVGAAGSAAGEWERRSYEPPKGLKQILRLAADRLGAALQKARDAEREAEREFLEKQNGLNAAVQKGKDLYNAGDIKAAVAEWRRTLPFVDDKREFESILRDLEKNQEDLQRVMAENKALLSSRKIGVPAEFRGFLEEAGRKLQAERSGVTALRKDLEDSFARKKEEFESVGQKGKRLYYEGSAREAAETFQGLLPYLEEGSGERAIILSLKENVEAVEVAKRDLVELKTRQAEELRRAFADLNEMLNKANDRLKSRLSEMEIQNRSLKALDKKGSAGHAPLEFTGGKIVSVDLARGRMTLALHVSQDGKPLTVKIDETTKVDGPKDKYTLSALQDGLEVDVRYDRRTARAAYIYIY